MHTCKRERKKKQKQFFFSWSPLLCGLHPFAEFFFFCFNCFLRYALVVGVHRDFAS